ALRRTFKVPGDDARLQVYLADGARFVRERPGRYDILLVDGYDQTGIPAALSTQAFYDDCHAALAPGGVFASNLYATDAAAHVDRLQRAFGPDRVWTVGETRQSNRVAFAWTGEPLPDGRIDLHGLTAAMPRAVARALAGALGRAAAAGHGRCRSAGHRGVGQRKAGAHVRRGWTMRPPMLRVIGLLLFLGAVPALAASGLTLEQLATLRTDTPAA